MKECFKCHRVLPLDEFYKHKRMADGHLNKCKDCAKSDASKHREKNLDKIREYDRGRGNRQSIDDLRKYRADYPNKYRAHTKVNNEKRKGNLVEKPCEICGSTDRIHAHHDDYLEPLNIRWLCAVHHHQWHSKHGEAKNP